MLVIHLATASAAAGSTASRSAKVTVLAEALLDAGPDDAGLAVSHLA